MKRRGKIINVIPEILRKKRNAGIKVARSAKKKNSLKFCVSTLRSKMTKIVWPAHKRYMITG